ncbi:MAG: DsrE family protein [Bacillota bacterium]
MKYLFILNDPPYGTERSYNGLRLVNSLAQNESTEVRVFLMGDAAFCAKAGQNTPNGYYNLEKMIAVAIKRGVIIGICGSCMDARGLTSEEIAAGTSRGSLQILAEWTEWADKVLVF